MTNVDSPLGLDWASLRGIGTRRSTFKFILLDKDLNTLGELDVDQDSPPSIENNINRSVKRTVSGLVFPVDQAQDVNLLSDRLRIEMHLPDGPYPLGVFMWADPSTRRSTAGNWIEASLVDQALVLDQPIGRPYALPPGSIIATAIKERIQQRGLSEFDVQHTGTYTGSEWSVWPTGTTSLEIINDLAAQAGCYSIYFDNNGKAIVKSVPDMAASTPDITYDVGTSVFAETIVESNDLLTAPNRYIVINNGMTNTPIHGKWDIPDSAPHSIENRGFVVAKVYDDQTVADNASAKRMAQAIGESDTSTYEWATFETAINPRHDTFDIVEWENRKYHEQSWGFILHEGSPMRHELRRVFEPPLAEMDLGL